MVLRSSVLFLQLLAAVPTVAAAQADEVVSAQPQHSILDQRVPAPPFARKVLNSSSAGQAISNAPSSGATNATAPPSKPDRASKSPPVTTSPGPKPQSFPTSNQRKLQTIPTRIPPPRLGTSIHLNVSDAHVKRTQTGRPKLTQAPLSSAAAPPLPTLNTSPTSDGLAGQSISLQTALYGALTSNPDLVSLREGNPIAPSPEAVEVARHFPTTLNPTIWVDYRPITLIPPNTFANQRTSAAEMGGHGGFYHWGQQYIYVSLRQPVELGHQTTHRYRIAQAAYNQQRWNVVQLELTTLVQTYRFFQTAAYRREKYQLAERLAEFNDRLARTLQQRFDAGQVPAADVTLARVESSGTRQQIKATRQDYLTALADLRNQIGIPEEAGNAVPLGEFTLPPYIPPVDEQAMLQTALANRPDIHAAMAQVTGTRSAIDLAKGDRIPTPVIGPEYASDEAGIQYVGLVYITPLPIWNSGKPLLRQREAEHQRALIAAQQAQKRAIAQVRNAVARWNAATDLVNESTGLTTELSKQVNDLEQLFDAGQTDLTRLMQARQRLIQLDNSRLDAVWAATQAQADLLLALGTPSLINAMLQQAEREAIPTTPQPPWISPLPSAALPSPPVPQPERN
jgi:outer membrane protein, heavy metal efflux system